MYHTFPTQKTRGKIIVPPVVKLRHAKGVVSRQYPRKKPVSGMHSSRIASYAFGVFFSREDSLEKYRRCALLLLRSLTPLLWSLLVKCRRSCWYVTDK